MSEIQLKVVPLSSEAFAPFGEVIECAGHQAMAVNQGMGQRFNDLASIDTGALQGKTLLSIFTSEQYNLPHRVTYLERHPLGSQAFMPLSRDPFVVVVAHPGEYVQTSQLSAFISNGRQGVNYHKGTWHHVLCTPFAPMQFLCVDRGGPGNNCEELWFEQDQQPLLVI